MVAVMQELLAEYVLRWPAFYSTSRLPAKEAEERPQSLRARMQAREAGGRLTSVAGWESEEERWAVTWAWNLRKAWARLVAARVRTPGRSVSRSSAAMWPSVKASLVLQLAVRRISSLLRSAKLGRHFRCLHVYFIWLSCLTCLTSSESAAVLRAAACTGEWVWKCEGSVSQSSADPLGKNMA